MRELNFDFTGIADLIQEVGQNIQLCQRTKAQTGNRDYGVSNDYQLTCKVVLGYAVPETYSQIALGNNNNSTVGGYTCYISAEKVKRSDFNEQTRIVWLDRIYQVQYQLEHLDRGHPRLHQLKLVPSIEPSSVNSSQPDPIYNDT